MDNIEITLFISLSQENLGFFFRYFCDIFKSFYLDDDELEFVMDRTDFQYAKEIRMQLLVDNAPQTVKLYAVPKSNIRDWELRVVDLLVNEKRVWRRSPRILLRQRVDDALFDFDF